MIENREEFPLDSKVDIEALIPSSNRNYNHEQMNDLLTKGFVKLITQKSWVYGSDNDEPIVQILHSDYGRFQTFSSRFDKVKIVCLAVVDGDGHKLTARVTAHLPDTAVHLKPGHILRLKLFNDLLMKPHPNSPPTAVIVIVQMDILGSGPFIADESEMTTLTIREMPVECPQTGIDEQHAEFNDEDFEPPPVPERCCTYDCHTCSMYGLNFRRCICDKIPVSHNSFTRQCSISVCPSVLSW